MSPQQNDIDRPARVPRAALGVLWLAAALATATCTDTATSTCADGLRCPADKVCLESENAPMRCESPAMIDACEGRSEGAKCSYNGNDGGINLGRCLSRVCTPARCGDGYVDGAEVCDDGDDIDGNGCNNDCQVQCGDGMVQEEQGEICDSEPPPGKHCVDYDFDMGALGCADNCMAANTDACISFGWPSMAELPDDWQIARIWVFSPENAVAVGVENSLSDFSELKCLTCGRIFRYDGNKWTEERRGLPLLLDLWANGPDDIYAVGALGTILHYDGRKWSSMELSIDYHFTSIWSSGPNDIFAVGAYWQPDLSDPDLDTAMFLALHYDGHTWEIMDIPEITPMPWRTILSGVWGSGPDDVFAIGPENLVLHYDGNPDGHWRRMENVPSGESWLFDIWGTGADDVFAVGQRGTILRYDGVAWSSMATQTNRTLTGIWGYERNRLFAVGEAGTLLRLDRRENGEWVALKPATSSHLTHVHGSDADNILAVGTDGTVLRRTDSVWTTMDMQANRSSVNEVWGNDIDCVYAVTEEGTIWHYDGNLEMRWQPMTADAQPPLRGVHGLSCDKDLYAVGDSGMILRLVAGAWTRMPSPTSASFHAVWVAGPNAVFVVGEERTILRYDGNPEGRWEPMTSGGDVKLKAVWGTSASNVFAVGTGSTILHYDGNREGRWTPMEIDAQRLLKDVWGSAPNDIFAVGEMEYVINYDGEEWMQSSHVPSLAGRSLQTVWGNSASDIFVGGSRGMLLHYDGTHWSPMRSPTEQDILTFWSTPDGRQLLVGDETGRIFRLVRPHI